MHKKDKQLLLLSGSVVLAVLFGWLIIQQDINQCSEQGQHWDHDINRCVSDEEIKEQDKP